MLRVAKLLEQFDMQWVEYDNWDPQALLQIKQSTSHAARLLREPGDDAAVPPVPRAARDGRGHHRRAVERLDLRAVQIGRMAEAYEINIAPHNYYSHLADLDLGAPLRARCPNVRIMEIDIDDVAWKTDLVTKPPTIKDGHIFLPDGAGLGRRDQRGGAAGAPVAGPGRAGAELLRHEPGADAGPAG